MSKKQREEERKGGREKKVGKEIIITIADSRNRKRSLASELKRTVERVHSATRSKKEAALTHYPIMLKHCFEDAV